MTPPYPYFVDVAMAALLGLGFLAVVALGGWDLKRRIVGTVVFALLGLGMLGVAAIILAEGGSYRLPIVFLVVAALTPLFVRKSYRARAAEMQARANYAAEERAKQERQQRQQTSAPN